jgi:hypothetical protein
MERVSRTANARRDVKLESHKDYEEDRTNRLFQLMMTIKAYSARLSLKGTSIWGGFLRFHHGLVTARTFRVVLVGLLEACVL